MEEYCAIDRCTPCQAPAVDTANTLFVCLFLVCVCVLLLLLFLSFLFLFVLKCSCNFLGGPGFVVSFFYAAAVARTGLLTDNDNDDDNDIHTTCQFN